MNRNLKFEIASSWIQPPPEADRDVANLTISLGDICLTRLVETDTNTVRDFLRASAVSLALWFADNWWRIRFEPIPEFMTTNWRLRHELTSAPGGTTWPPLMIYGAGPNVLFSPIASPVDRAGPIEFFGIPTCLALGSNYEKGLDSFFEQVVNTCAKALDGKVLGSIVRQLENERGDIDLSAYRRLEAMLGFDPDDAPEGLIDQSFAFEERFGGDAIEEAAVANPGSDAFRILNSVIEASVASKITADFTDAVKAVNLPSENEEYLSTWAIAETAAESLRKAIGRDHGPLLNRALSELLKSSSLSLNDAAPTANALPYGARLRETGDIERIAVHANSSRGRRFELARALGDAIWSAQSSLGVISHGKTERQKFQRAFAQSLLCPFSEVRNLVDLSAPTNEQINNVATHFHVDRSVVRTLLVNKRCLPRATLAESFEAA